MKGLKLIAFAGARKGSMGVREKTERCIAGKPLMVWIVEEAVKTNDAGTFLDEIWIFHNDRKILAQVAEYPGVTATYSEDYTQTYAIMRERLLAMEEKPKYMVILDPTSPLVTAEDIRAIVVKTIFVNTRGIADCVAAVCDVAQAPEKMLTIDHSGAWRWVMGEPNKVMKPRQEYPTSYQLTSCCSVVPAIHYMRESRPVDAYSDWKWAPYIIPRERGIHIDTDYDWALAEMFLTKRLDVKSSWFDDVHINKRAFVMGNGPGLNTITPEQWTEIDKDITIGVNGINETHDVKYLLMTDINEIFNFPIYDSMRRSVVASKAKWKLCLEDYIKHAQPYIQSIAWKKAAKPSNRYRDGLWLTNNSVHAALNLALIMGCDPIVLLGLDYHEMVHATKHSADNPDVMWDMNIPSVIGFEQLALLAQKMGRTVINALPDSRLPYFEKKPLTEILTDGRIMP